VRVAKLISRGRGNPWRFSRSFVRSELPQSPSLLRNDTQEYIAFELPRVADTAGFGIFARNFYLSF